MAVQDIQIEQIEVDVDAAFEDSQKMVEPYPTRGPAASVYGLRPFIEDKVVCDLGCGGGDLAWLMGRWAKQVYGIEYDPNRIKNATRHLGSLRNYTNVSISQDDYFTCDLPDADVFYFWPNDPETIDRMVGTLDSRGKSCILVQASKRSWLDTELKQQPCIYPNGKRRLSTVLSYVESRGGRVLSYPYREHSIAAEVNPDFWPHEDTWCLSIVPINGSRPSVKPPSWELEWRS